ncbi:MAG TPA: LON peptidase substrate-binding domain-containing protein [Microlunatus sp.]|nr:LON peptidase substrate-binding domain-containing protein [Microlunatus sp.]
MADRSPLFYLRPPTPGSRGHAIVGLDRGRHSPPGAGHGWLASVATLAIFPLGAVLFPNMPLRLRVFEERYLVMLSEMLKAQQGEFGVVLIERGREVGGGEHRFDIGTTAEITELGAQDTGIVVLRAHGHRRFRVERWLDDAPHPRAEVSELPDLVWDPVLAPRLQECERVVRQALAAASEFVDATWPADVELADEPVPRLWQLAGISPVGPLDQLDLLRAPSVPDLIERLIRLTGEASTAWDAPWPD